LGLWTRHTVHVHGTAANPAGGIATSRRRRGNVILMDSVNRGRSIVALLVVALLSSGCMKLYANYKATMDIHVDNTSLGKRRGGPQGTRCSG